MAAPRDQNSVVALLGTFQGIATPILATNLHRLKVSDGVSGTDTGPLNAPRDRNQRPALIATSSADGKTPVVVYADASGNLLIKST